jgi:alkylation response protein AidB-like acyl-CoA dehydrogenase
VTALTMSLPGHLADFCATATREVHSSGPTPTWVHGVNQSLARISRSDVSAGCLAWRAVSNAVRLAAFPGTPTPVASLVAGRLVVTSLNASQTTAIRKSSGAVRVTGNRLMVTGLAYADYLLVEALIDGDQQPSAMIVPAASVTSVLRPRLRGLPGADNALINLEANIEPNCVLGGPGAAHQVTEAPYATGLTFGAIAHGALLRLCDYLAGDPRFDGHPELIGATYAATAAAGALVDSCARQTTEAAWHSRAAKVFATTTATDHITRAITIAGAAAYTFDHPLSRLADDVAGLAFQAPTNQGSYAHLAKEKP